MCFIFVLVLVISVFVSVVVVLWWIFSLKFGLWFWMVCNIFLYKLFLLCFKYSVSLLVNFGNWLIEIELVVFVICVNLFKLKLLLIILVVVILCINVLCCMWVFKIYFCGFFLFLLVSFWFYWVLFVWFLLLYECC